MPGGRVIHSCHSLNRTDLRSILSDSIRHNHQIISLDFARSSCGRGTRVLQRIALNGLFKNCNRAIFLTSETRGTSRKLALQTKVREETGFGVDIADHNQLGIGG